MVFWTFFTGNQGENCHNKYISKRVEISLFNMGLNVLILTRVGESYLGVRNNENESWVDMSWIFYVTGWSVYGLKCQWVEVAMGWSVYGLKCIRVEVSMGWSVNGLKCQWVEVSMGWSVYGLKCLWVEVSMGWSVHGLKCIWVEVAMGWNVWLPF